MAVSDGHKILIAAHIDDFIISCAHRPTLDTFKHALLARFDGTSEMLTPFLLSLHHIAACLKTIVTLLRTALSTYATVVLSAVLDTLSI